MQVLLQIIHITAAILLVLIILLQHGQGGGLSGMFGGGSGMDDVLSTPSGGEYLKKATTTLAVIFFFTSLVLAIRTTKAPSIMERGEMPGVPGEQVPGGMPSPETFDEPVQPETDEVPAEEPPPLETP